MKTVNVTFDIDSAMLKLKTIAGYDNHGYDVDGFDKNGYDSKGFDVNGYNGNGVHYNTANRFVIDEQDDYPLF